MVNIIQERRRPSFSERLSEGVGAGIEGIEELREQHQGRELNKRFKEEFGVDPTGMDPQSRNKLYSDLILQSRKNNTEKKDLGSSFGTILEEMKSLKENVGPFNISALNPWSETSGKRSQINTLRLSLEGLFRDLTLKGQFPKAIYERILKELPQASDTEGQYLNKIEAIEKILQSHFEEGQQGQKKAKQKFNKENPEHLAKAKQLHNTYKDKEKVREILKREFEGL